MHPTSVVRILWEIQLDMDGVNSMRRKVRHLQEVMVNHLIICIIHCEKNKTKQKQKIKTCISGVVHELSRKSSFQVWISSNKEKKFYRRQVNPIFCPILFNFWKREQ